MNTSDYNNRIINNYNRQFKNIIVLNYIKFYINKN